MPRKTTPSTRRAPRRSPKPAEGSKTSEASRMKNLKETAGSRIQAMIDSGKPALERAQAFATETGRNLSKQSQAIRKDIALRVSDIGTRVEKERKSLGRSAEGAVKSTLASLNIPTRSEINLLARRVEELSRRIDSLKRR